MKTTAFCRRLSGALLLATFLAYIGFTETAPPEQPRIVSIHVDSDELIVTVSVPAGARKVTLESRPRIGSGGWEPRAVSRLDPDDEGGQLVFRLPASGAFEVLRVRVDAEEPLPARFYDGETQFDPEPAGSGGWTDFMTGDGSREGAPPAAEGDRDVVESDIWKIRGDTLYFFNQYRGLQILDVSEPDNPRVTGSLPLPAAGEQMYLLESGELVLLVRESCWWSAGYPESRVLIVAVVDDAPVIVAELPVQGWIQESRLVGSALYVAAQYWRPITDSQTGAWETGVEVSGFDLKIPSEPEPRNSLWYPGYGHVVAATDRYFFVTVQDPREWRTSIVHLIDIRDPDGTLAASGSIRAAGRIDDKFKIHLYGNVLTLISEVWTTTLHTRLETFSVENPAAPQRLGSLSLGLSERLFATRFVNDRVYVVTFFVPLQMDPLWVVCLSDPENPAVLGELEVPGWSTFLYPLGDQLVAAGIETNQTTVSLFDVADPARPTLLERVALGSGWSWSEANHDEKAFQVLPEAGLVLVPYQSWEDGAWRSRVQLIDLLPDTLVARGAIDHTMSPRRATLHRDRILSISGRELLTVHIEYRDHPVVTAELPLAWPVDRLLVHGDYLIEFSRGHFGWGDPAPAEIRIAPAEDPDRILAMVRPANRLPILGAGIREQHLYLVQGVEGGHWIESDPDDHANGEEAERAPNLFLTIYHIQTPTDLVPIGHVEVALDPLGWSADFQMLWPKPDVLVLTGGGNDYWRLWLDWPMIGAEPGFDGPTLWRPIAPYGGGGGRLIAFDVRDSTAPKFVSEVNLAGEDRWNFSVSRLGDGLVFLSHQVAEPAPPIVIQDEVTGEWITREPPSWMWVQRSYLNVVDYTDPADPMVRRPVPIPGSLIGLSHDGAIVYTVGARWEPDPTWTYDPTEWLEAGAYDGVAVHRVDSLELPQVWPRPLLARNGDIFLGRANPHTRDTAGLESWRLSEEGHFVPVGKIELGAPADRLHAFDGLLAVQSGVGVVLFDALDPAELRRVGGDTPPGCLWIDLRRADGNLDRGLWVPIGLNGVWRLPLVHVPGSVPFIINQGAMR